jgi:hypothetical protein
MIGSFPSKTVGLNVKKVAPLSNARPEPESEREATEGGSGGTFF